MELICSSMHADTDRRPFTRVFLILINESRFISHIICLLKHAFQFWFKGKIH